MRGLICEWVCQAQQALEMHHGAIADAIGALHHYFAADSADVQREWLRYKQKVGTCSDVPAHTCNRDKNQE